MEKNYFAELFAIDVSGKTEKKNGLTYLSWAWAWAELKKLHPDATYQIYEDGTGCFYHTDGRTCWVKTGVTVAGIEHIEYLPVMDLRNRSIPADQVTSFDVNKAIQRSLTKAVARHGLGLYIYAGEDLPEEESVSYDEPKRTRASKPKDEPVLTKEHKDALILLATEKYGDDAPVKFVEITGVRNLGAIPDAAFEKLKKLLEEAET